MRPFTDEEFEELPHILWTSEDDWDPTSLDSVISDDPNWYEAEPSPPLPDPMYDEYGEFRGRVLINQREWQVHYFDALDTKPSSDNNEFHDALEQFADDPDSVIDLVVYHANHVCYVCDHETVEGAPKLDNITQRGAPTKLISDCAQVEISERVKQVIRPLHSATWQSEPHQQHQNPAKCQYQNIKRLSNTILDHSGAPAYTWLLCLM
jgi:hypothetical protein